MRWSHVGLNCRDPKATEEFYTRWFGFSRVRTVRHAGAEIAFLRNGPACLELFAAGAGDGAAAPAGADGPAVPGEIRHLAFQTEDVDAFLAALGDAAEITRGPLDFDEVLRGWRSVWVRDPDGVIVEVSQGYRDERAPAAAGAGGEEAAP